MLRYDRPGGLLLVARLKEELFPHDFAAIRWYKGHNSGEAEYGMVGLVR